MYNDYYFVIFFFPHYYDYHQEERKFGKCEKFPKNRTFTGNACGLPSSLLRNTGSTSFTQSTSDRIRTEHFLPIRGATPQSKEISPILGFFSPLVSKLYGKCPFKK